MMPHTNLRDICVVSMKILFTFAAGIAYLAHTAAYGNEGDGSLGRFVELKEEDIANIYRLML